MAVKMKWYTYEKRSISKKAWVTDGRRYDSLMELLEETAKLHNRPYEIKILKHEVTELSRITTTVHKYESITEV